MWNTIRRDAIIELIQEQDESLRLRAIAREIANDRPENIEEIFDMLERAICESGNLEMMQKYNVGWQWKGFEIVGNTAVSWGVE